MLKVGSSFFSIQVKAHSQTCWYPLYFYFIFFDVIGALNGGEHLFGFTMKLSHCSRVQLFLRNMMMKKTLLFLFMHMSPKLNVFRSSLVDSAFGSINFYQLPIFLSFSHRITDNICFFLLLLKMLLQRTHLL